ncbi:MAG: DHH family phosphoesterase [Longimicrobiales bacterium]
MHLPPGMDGHPAIRRRARTQRHEAEHPPNETRNEPTLIIVTDDRTFAEPRVAQGTRVWHWSARRDAGKPGMFSGDPTDAGTYHWARLVPDLSAIVALRSPVRTAAATAAIQQANPVASVLVVGTAERPEVGGLLTRPVDVRAALRTSLEHELHQLDTLKRVQALHTFAGEEPVIPILVHKDPDPDALASALAIRVVLQRRPNETPVVTLDEMTRPENRRMAELLDIQVIQVTSAELNAFAGIICVDMQPRGIVTTEDLRVAIIDHHPYEYEGIVQCLDVRPHYGATATILTEYLRAEDERRINKWLATGLVYAIKTDTDNLARGVSAADVSAYTFLLERIDAPLLRRIERPALSADTARAFGQAVAGLLFLDDLAVAYLGKLPADQSHILADVADFCLAIEEATWAAAGAIVEGNLVINLRHLGGAPGAGSLARALSLAGGSGGGHAAMARAVLPLVNEWGALSDAPHHIACKLLLERLAAELEHIRSS